MQKYLATFRRLFPGTHHIFASITLILGVFAVIYTLGVSQGFFLRGFITSLDKSVLDVILLHRDAARSGFFLFFTYLGNAEIIASLSLVILLIMTLSRKVRAAWFFIIALFAGQSLSLLFKYLLVRSRPDTAHALIEQGGYSFPSGHAMGSVVFYGMLGYFLCTLLVRHRHHILVTLSTVAVIALIGISRLYLGVHWLSDVVAGWIMGSTLLIVFIVFFEHRKNLFPVVHRDPWVSRFVLIVSALLLSLAEALFIAHFFLSHPLR